ncbi:hypothetical protein EFL26_18575 [Nocardioides pocheonensis]|uniref:Uncharacterized protein n=1 Tax=Nocardioides pocheonensis TaxID=661485 RepID=A0A3N0GJK2_9ACTN|nr:hypothetical protein EFL26_18575 [Nocardioides pocheonensis]
MATAGGPEHAGVRRAGAAGVVAAAAWIALGMDSTVRGGEMHYRDALVMVPWVLTMVTLAGVHLAQRDRLRRWGHVAFGVLGLAMVLGLLGDLGTVLDIAPLATLGFPLGALLWLVAMVPAGVATYRAGVLPRRVGVLMALLEPLSIATGVALSPIAGLHDRGNYSGGLEKGLVVLMIALALRSVAAYRDERRPAP